MMRQFTFRRHGRGMAVPKDDVLSHAYVPAIHADLY